MPLSQLVLKGGMLAIFLGGNLKNQFSRNILLFIPMDRYTPPHLSATNLLPLPPIFSELTLFEISKFAT